MTPRIRLAVAVMIAVVAAGGSVRAFTTFGQWANGTITMNLQLSGTQTLTDGTAGFNNVATSALAIWNQYISRVRFSAVPRSAAQGGDGDGQNQVFFDSTLYGDSFGNGTLAVTTSWFRGSRMVETDVVFNNRYTWDSYRGALRSRAEDFRRVAIHEFGHVLGLDHPDEAGQRVNAIMNSTASDIDTVTSDDIAGAQSLYGGAGVVGTVSFPPRNEPAAFYTQLISVYQNELRAAPSSTYVDSEGAVIWLTEYARQRVGQCSHDTATTNTLNQITSNGTTLVCATTPAGAIPFPPRNEGLLFMNQLDATYRDALRRSQGTTAVNNEGTVVWTLEYLRYRLNGCNHADASTKVFQQIRGQGIQPVCR